MKKSVVEYVQAEAGEHDESVPPVKPSVRGASDAGMVTKPMQRRKPQTAQLTRVVDSPVITDFHRVLLLDWEEQDAS